MTGSRRTAFAWSVGVLALAVGGCGGGGGGTARPEPGVPPISSPSPTPTPTPPAPTTTPTPTPTPSPSPTSINFDDTEYRRSAAANSSGAITAWSAGATGRGIDIAVIDGGINPNLADFAGRIHPASRDLGGARGVSDTEGHGTAVSAVAAAARNGRDTVGLAFDARILSLNTSNPNDCGGADGCRHLDSTIAQGIDVARQNGARIINISLGGEGASQSLISAIQRASAAGIIIVVSAGNEGQARPSGMAIAAGDAGGANVIIAGSIGASPGDDPANGTDLTQISTFSNRAGPSASRFLAARGYRVGAPDHKGDLFLWSGTSFAAPVISGAAALLASAFPNLTGAQIVQLLFSTADDLGAPGADPVFGRGGLNLPRAFQPQGTLRAVGTAQGAVSTSSGNGVMSGAMGDATPMAAGVIVLDGFDRAYALDLAQTLTRAPTERPLAAALQPGLTTSLGLAGATAVSVTVRRDFAGRSQLEISQTGLGPDDARQARVVAGSAITRLTPRTALAMGFSETGHALQQRLGNTGTGAFLIARDPGARAGFSADGANSIGVRHDLGPATLTLTGEQGEVADANAVPTDRSRSSYTQMTVAAERRIGRANLTVGLTRLQEESTVLGGRFGFAPDGAASTFLDLGLRYDLGGQWGTQARMRSGWTALPGSNGFVQGGSMSSDSWSLDLWRTNAFSRGDTLSFRVTQPLRVRAGGYQLNLPSSYDYADGSVGYELASFGLAPRGREIDFEAAYSLPLFEGAGSVSGNAFLRRQPGHIEAAGDDVGTAIRFTLGF